MYSCVRLKRCTLVIAILVSFMLIIPSLQVKAQTSSDFKKKLDIDISESPEKPPAITPPLPDVSTSDESGPKKLSYLPSIYVRSFNIEGNSIFSDEELSEITMPYENRMVSFEELQRLRKELTLHYINNGFINSGAVIPDQEVTDNVITLKIIEGELKGISLQGNRYFKTSYLEKRIGLAAGPPLNIISMQRALQILQQDKRIKRVNAELKPGPFPGEALLNVKVEEERPYNIGVEAGNEISSNV